MWIGRDAVRERISDIVAARNFYNAQPAIVALRESVDEFRWHIDDTLVGTREAYVQAARQRAFSPYAVVHDGQWIAQGEMGWFGISSDAETDDNWSARVSVLIDNLSDDTLLTIVDCHI